jgi:hypothetical protein
VHYQTDSQFDAQVQSMEEQPAPGTPKFDAWIKQLLDQSIDDPPDANHSAFGVHNSEQKTFSGTQTPPRSDPMAAFLNPAVMSRNGSPERPNYSPISDAGR